MAQLCHLPRAPVESKVHLTMCLEWAISQGLPAGTRADPHFVILNLFRAPFSAREHLFNHTN